MERRLNTIKGSTQLLRTTHPPPLAWHKDICLGGCTRSHILHVQYTTYITFEPDHISYMCTLSASIKHLLLVVSFQYSVSCFHPYPDTSLGMLLAGCSMWGGSGRRGRSGSTASRAWRPSSSVWRSRATTSCWRRTRRWTGWSSWTGGWTGWSPHLDNGWLVGKKLTLVVARDSVNDNPG